MPDGQDWEWQVADPARIKEFIAAYKDGSLKQPGLATNAFGH